MMGGRNDSSSSSTRNAATTTTTTTTKINTAEQFLKELQLQVPKFMTQVVSHLRERYHIDCSNLIADHVCWRTETLEEYLSLVECLQKQNDDDIGNDDKDDPQHQNHQQRLTQSNKSFFDLLIESEIGGRPIATFGLLQAIGGITCGSNLNHIIDVIEIPSPKKGSPYRSGLEHVEFVIGAATKKESNHPSPPPTPSNRKDISATTTNANTAPANHNNGTTIVTCPMNDSIHHDSLKAYMAIHSTATIPTQSTSDSNTKTNDTLIVPWNTKALTKTINPDISLELKLEEPFGICTVKFHLMPLREVIEWEKKHNHGDR